jgi:nucleoside-diphosphate-sugar epimerase
MRILVLGGTAWVGRTTAELARDAGHDVTCLARGESGSAPTGVTFVRADRSTTAGYRGLRGDFDRVVDVSSQPGHVRSAAAALQGRVGRYVFVSTGNVYAEHSRARGTEQVPLLAPLEADEMADMEQYGEAKVACETSVAQAFPAHTIARAGLIGGPGDTSGRTAYWPWRFAHPSNPQGRVLVPVAPHRTAQVIDVRDLCRWLLAAEADGAFNLVGDAMPLADHLEIARQTAGHRGEVVRVDEEWIAAHDIAAWAGPRSFPLWLNEPGWEGFTDRSNARAKAAGLVLRPLTETLRWATHAENTWAAGLSDADERELLAQL